MQLAVVEKHFLPTRFLAPTGKEYEREIKLLRKQAAVTYLENISTGRLGISILKCKLTSSIDMLNVASLCYQLPKILNIYFPEVEAGGEGKVVEPVEAPKMHTSDPVFKVDEVYPQKLQYQ